MLADKPLAQMTADLYVFDIDFAADVSLFFDTSADDWLFTDGANTCTSTGESFSAGDIITLTCTASAAGGLDLYKNGVSIASDATYSPQAGNNYLYIGSKIETSSLRPAKSCQSC